MDRIHEINGDVERGLVIGGGQKLVREIVDAGLELFCSGLVP